MRFRLLPTALLGGAVSLLASAFAAAANVAIVIDDIGDRMPESRRAVALPGPVTCAFLPHTPHAAVLAEAAHAAGKEVMVHLPMEAMADNARLGPGALTLHMTRERFVRTVLEGLAAVPHARGINNHMGSLLTRHPGAMEWLMETLAADRNLFFVDSRTTVHTVAEQVALEHAVPATRRDVFLDNVRTEAAVRAQFEQLIRRARRHGSALAIGHPYPETLAVLAAELPRLAERGVTLLPVSELIRQRHPGRNLLWQASLSPSPTAAKNSKP